MNDVAPNWWSRNWKWVVPCGCLVLIGVAAAFVGGLVWAVRTAMTSSEAYQLAVERAVRHPAVIETLGEPVEPGWFVSGSVEVTGPAGTADISVPIRGSRGRGTLYVVAEKSAGEWSFERLELESGGSRYDLLEPEDAAGESAPAAPPPTP